MPAQEQTAGGSYLSQEHMGSRTLPRDTSDYGTLFTDPVNVHQWAGAVTDASGSVMYVDNFQLGQMCSNISNNTGGEVSTDGVFRGYPSNIPSCQLSLSSHSRTSDSPVSQAPPSDIYNAHASENTVLSAGAMHPANIGFIDGNSVEDYLHEPWLTIDDQPSGLPISEDMTFTTSTDSYQHMVSDNVDDPCLEGNWLPAQFQAQIPLDSSPAYHCNNIVWSPPSVGTMDPSVSSSLSQSSFMLPHGGSPALYCSPEGMSSIAPNDEYGLCVPPHRGSVQFPEFQGPYDTDPSSTLRPAHVLQRMPLSPTVFLPQSDALYYPPMASSYGESYMHRRPSGEGEKSTARCDELYQIRPQEDGLYHCPFGPKNGCTHKPEKLKCNYDKHLDSHLKPYRCKVWSCGTVSFSSTACLLRHEREAHGMHGHGEKPYLCKYTDCDRSIIGNGFPRRWNLQDHMKRVHDDIGPSSVGSASPSPSSVSSTAPSKVTTSGRKKRTINKSQELPTKRPKSTSAAKTVIKAGRSQSMSQQGKQKQAMQKQWQEQHTALQERLACLDPTDAFGCEQIDTEYTILRNIGRTLHELEVDQCAILD